MNAEMLGACDRILSAAANGIFQGILIAGFVAVGLRLVSRTNASTQHAIWFTTLLLLAALIPAHYLRDRYLGKGDRAAIERPRSEAAVAAPSGSESDADALESSSLSSSSSSLETLIFAAGAGFKSWEPLPGTVLPPREHVAGRSQEPTPQFERRTDRPAALHEEGEPTGPDSQGSIGQKSGWGAGRFLRPSTWSLSPQLPRRATLVLVAVWLTGIAAKTAILVLRFLQIRKLKAAAVPASAEMEALFQRMRQQLAVRRPVRLRLSPSHRSPVLLGFMHPVVLLPATQPANTAETEAILRHELAHVCRWDDWANLAQQCLQALLFFHPVVWWISRQLSIQREIACDDFVLQQSGHPRAYALLLADLASRVTTQRALLTPGVTTSKSQLQRRIDMILNTRRNASPRLAKSRLGFITSAAALLAALAIYSAPRLVLAQAPAAPSLPGKAPAVDASPGAAVTPVALPTPPGAPQVPVAVPEQPESPAARLPPAIEPGPKSKSGDSVTRVPEREIITSSATPVSSGVVVVRRDVVAGTPQALTFSTSSPAKSPGAPSVDSSVEQRLRRLEKLVDSLLQQKQPNPSSWSLNLSEKSYDTKLKQREEMAKHDAARARAAEQAKKSLNLQQNREAGKMKEDFARQIDSLQRERDALERQMENLQQQIERLQQQQEKLQELQQHQSGVMQNQRLEEDLTALLQDGSVNEANAAVPEQPSTD